MRAGEPHSGRGRGLPELSTPAGTGRRRDIGDICIAGGEDAIAAGLHRYAEAGATDLSVRLLPIGDTRDELIASKQRTREMIAAIAQDLR